MMLSNTQALFNLFIALITLQQASSALALPTRGSYGQLARRANAAKRAAPTQAARAARLTRQQAYVQKRAEEEVASKNAASVESQHFAAPSAHVIQVNPKLELKQKEVNATARLASARNGTSLVDGDTSASTTEDDAANAEASAEAAKKAASIGGGYSMFAANNGVPSSATSTAIEAESTSSSWVSASNVTLPSGLSKRDLVSGTTTNNKQQLKKRVVPHPGEPSATIKINVIGGDILQNFTIIETSKASSTKASTSIKPAQTSANVNIVHNNTGSGIPEDESDDATLLTFTFTLPLAAINTGNETVTLVPAGNDSYIPYINNKEIDNDSNNDKATCTIPVDDDVLVAVARGQTFYAVCVSKDAVSKRIKVKVDVNLASTNGTSSSSSSTEKSKRQMIAHFQSPALSQEAAQKEKRQVVAFFEAPSHNVEAEDNTGEHLTYTREEMMSDLWEDCIVGVDEGCLELPEE